MGCGGMQKGAAAYGVQGLCNGMRKASAKPLKTIQQSTTNNQQQSWCFQNIGAWQLPYCSRKKKQ